MPGGGQCEGQDQGWRPYGYEDPTPPRATPDEAVDDLVEMDAEEQRMQRWPE
jgi:hypothetical protein